MKNGKAPTREQKKIMKAHGLGSRTFRTHWK